MHNEIAKLKDKTNHELVIATYFEKCEKLVNFFCFFFILKKKKFLKMGENKEFFENYMGLKSKYKSSEQDREKCFKNKIYLFIEYFF